jgi:hypothetical protein
MIAAARRRLGIVEEAMRQHTRATSELLGAVHGELNRALRSQRQPFVSRVNAALLELRALADEEDGLRKALYAAGVDAGRIDSLAFAQASAGSAYDDAWRRGVKAIGFTV